MDKYERMERIDYLYGQAVLQLANPEQEEAYLQRIKEHWAKLLEQIETSSAMVAPNTEISGGSPED